MTSTRTPLVRAAWAGLILSLMVGVIAESPALADTGPEEQGTTNPTSFNESAGCGNDPSGVIVPMTTTDDPGRTIPPGHEVRGPWGTAFGRNFSDVASNMVTWAIPMSGGRTVSVHRNAYPAFQRVTANLAAEQAAGRYYAVRMAGSFVWRRIGGSSRMSMHSFGTTIDINWDTNPYIDDHPLPGRSGYTDMPTWFVDAWTDAGFCWGGDWLGVKDAMHFSWRGPGATPGYGKTPRPSDSLYEKQNFQRSIGSRQSGLAGYMSSGTGIVDAGRDGHPDLVSIERFGVNKAKIEIAHGFTELRACGIERRIATNVPSGAEGLTLDHADSDSRADLIGVGSSGGQTRLWISSFESGYRSWSATTIPVAYSKADVIRFGDFNRDGDTDLFVFDLRSGSTGVRVYDGSDGWQTKLVYRLRPTAWTASDALLGTRDNDGVPDVFLIGPEGANEIAIRVGRHNYGKTTTKTTAVTSGGVANGMGDWDGDGRDDIFRVTSGGQVDVYSGSTNSNDYLFWVRMAGEPCRPVNYPAQPFDLDGDGFPEMAVGAPGEGINSVAGAGHVSVAYGGSVAFANGSQGLWTTNFAGESAGLGERFGHAITSGDYDGDGYADLLTSLPKRDAAGRDSSGAVALYRGSEDGLEPDRLLHADSTGVPGSPGTNARFGASLATGDFDGDGYHDAVVGSPRRDVGGSANNAGAVAVLYGSPELGPGGYASTLLTQNSPGIAGAAHAGDRFGSALAAGDFDNDGYDDLAIGSPKDDVSGKKNAGNVSVLFGGPAGLDGGSSVKLDAASLTSLSPEKLDKFGSALAAGDIDGDGYSDLVVGAPGRESHGAIWVFFGSANGFDAARVLDQDDIGGDVAEDGDRFGSSVAVLDMDDDGFAEVAVGAPGETVSGEADAGAVDVVDGASIGGALIGWDISQANILSTSAETGDRVGYMLRAVDPTGDGELELMIGVPGEILGGVAGGTVHFVNKTSSGISQVYGSPRHQGKGFPQQFESGDLFGEG